MAMNGFSGEYLCASGWVNEAALDAPLCFKSVDENEDEDENEIICGSLNHADIEKLKSICDKDYRYQTFLSPTSFPPFPVILYLCSLFIIISNISTASSLVTLI